ncbi:hypothetical protein ABZZ20_22850 [Streptomyces sp. NPDC006430]|uniref:hypothetical protein n=1 Tax=Streptomyces sp. NPDC006430 TaxID=3154299 RepID=UPI0033B4850F
MGQKATRDVEPGRQFETATKKMEEEQKKQLDLSVTQIAGSSLATVAAALLASQLGVYGTILGAGVVSVVATAGGPVIQHFFKRTGDQLRGTARPGARQVPRPAAQEGYDDALPLRAAPPGGEFGEATVHGTRVRGWKRTAVASGAAFALALGGLGAYEAFSGTAISQGGGTIWSGGTRTAGDERPAAPREEPGTVGKGGRTPGAGTSPSASQSDGGRSPAPDPSPSDPGGPTPSPSPPTPSPEPTPSATPTPTPSADGSTPVAGQ